MSATARKFDPYEALGVARDATEADVRSAFRRKAKTAHPDAGGSSEEFTAINRAHVVLADPVRRARFDQTGVADDGSDNIDQGALNLIMGMVVGILMGDADPMQADLVAEMHKHIEKQIAATSEQLKRLERACRRAEKAKAKFVRKHKGGANQIARMIAVHAEAMQLQQAGIRRTIDVHRRAQAILDEYRFTQDEMQAAVYWNIGGTTASSSGTSTA